MIMVKGQVDGKEYKEPFSKGILARSLSVANMRSDKAYKIAENIESSLVEKSICTIDIKDLTEMISEYLNDNCPEFAEKYNKWRIIRKSEEPVIILIGGASGVGTSSMAFELANRLGLKNLISTDMIREVMRKIVSVDLSPVIHKSSFNAYESIKVHKLMADSVIEGFVSHIEVVNVGIEAIIERSIKEGISIIIEGVHVVPGFINKELMENNKIIQFTLIVDDEDMHRNRFYSRCRQPWVKRSLQTYLDNFESIRKTQSFMIKQSEENNIPIINNVDVVNTVDTMVDDIIEQYDEVKEC